MLVYSQQQHADDRTRKREPGHPIDRISRDQADDDLRRDFDHDTDL